VSLFVQLSVANRVGYGPEKRRRWKNQELMGNSKLREHLPLLTLFKVKI
jgi:hypothetical protein